MKCSLTLTALLEWYIYVISTFSIKSPAFLLAKWTVNLFKDIAGFNVIINVWLFVFFCLRNICYDVNIHIYRKWFVVECYFLKDQRFLHTCKLASFCLGPYKDTWWLTIIYNNTLRFLRFLPPFLEKFSQLLYINYLSFYW